MPLSRVEGRGHTMSPINELFDHSSILQSGTPGVWEGLWQGKQGGNLGQLSPGGGRLVVVFTDMVVLFMVMLCPWNEGMSHWMKLLYCSREAVFLIRA